MDKFLPRNIIVYILNEIDKAFSQADPSKGKEFGLKMLYEVRDLLDREWTIEKQDEVVERETQRWDTLKSDVCKIMGEDKWNELEAAIKSTSQDVVQILRRSYKDWKEVEETEDWKVLSIRCRDTALKFLTRPNVIVVGENLKNEVSILIEDDPFGVIKSNKSMSALMEEALLYATSRLNNTATKPKDDDDSLRAFVKFKDNNPVTPKSLAEIVPKFSPAAPKLREQVAKALEDVEKNGVAKKYHEFVLAQCLKALSLQRLEEWADSTAGLLDSEKKSTNLLIEAIKAKDVDRSINLGKSNALSLLLKLLPAAELPPIEGVRDGFAYSVKRLDMSRFHVLADNVAVKTLGTYSSVKRGDPFIRIVVDDVSMVMRNLLWEFKQENFPYLTGQGECDADVRGVCLILGFQVIRKPRAKCGLPLSDSSETASTDGSEKPSTPTSQKSSGPSNAIDDVDNDENEKDCVPQLILGVSRVHIDSVKIELKGMTLGNMLAEMFSATIRTYLCSLIEDEILEKVSFGLDRINNQIFLSWDTVLAAVDVRTLDLPTERQAAKRASVLDAPVTSRKDVYSVTFPHDGPLGIVLGKSNEFVIVRGFKRAPDGSQFPGEVSGKIKIGDMLCGLNGAEITSLPLDRVTARLARARRPLTLSFCAGSGDPAQGGAGGKKRNNIALMQFSEPKLGLLIKERPFQDRAAVVTGFKPNSEGGEGPAQKAGVPVGWVLAGINGQDTLKHSFKETMEIFASSQRPVQLKFLRDPELEVELNESPTDLKVAFLGGMVVVTKFDHLIGPGQTQCGDKLETGDYITRIGGKDTTLMRFEEVIGLIRTAPRPVEIRFGRDNSNANVCTAIFGPGPLGLAFYKSNKDGKCCFKTFQGIDGPVERTKLVFPGMVLVKVQGIDVKTEEHARDLLAKSTHGPIKLRFRDMDAFVEGKW